jgi:hypothetical protein
MHFTLGIFLCHLAPPAKSVSIIGALTIQQFFINHRGKFRTDNHISISYNKTRDKIKPFEAIIILKEKAMKRSILLSLVFLMISGCAKSPKTPEVIKATETTQSAATALAVVTPPTETAPTKASPAKTAVSAELAKIIFQDSFEGPLAKNWQWLNEDPANWSLQNVPGSLQINIERGYLNLKNIKNVLLTPAPEGNFQIETRLTFLTKNRTHFAGLLLYESENNFIKVGHAYCKPINKCVGDGLYLEEYMQGKLLTAPYVAQKYSRTTVSLRLVYKDGGLTFLSSPNGLVWYQISESKVDFKILQVGLVAGENLKEAVPVLFDYFQVKSIK